MWPTTKRVALVLLTAVALTPAVLSTASAQGIDPSGWRWPTDWHDVERAARPQDLFTRGEPSSSGFCVISREIGPDGSIYESTRSDRPGYRTGERAQLRIGPDGRAYWVDDSADNSPRRAPQYDRRALQLPPPPETVDTPLQTQGPLLQETVQTPFYQIDGQGNLWKIVGNQRQWVRKVR